MFFVSLNNSFSLPKEFLLTVDGHFQTKGNYQNIYIARNRLMVDIGLTRSFLSDQLRIELKGHDLFHGMNDKNLIYNQKMQLFQINRNDTRQIELTVRYNFNTAKSKYKGTNAGEEEIKRF